MPKIIIDDRDIIVPPGTKVIEAAERLGIMIPRFCYHPALGSVGACRLCAVKFLEGPFKGVQMSCMIEAKDGMVVSTTDEEAVDFRKQVIEWLMLNHPHDCPVCDEGGHCLLQDMTVSGGHGVRRYLGKKRTYLDQYLGTFVQHEMNRCIHCYRCSRFYQEFAGYRDLGPMQIGNRTYFGRFKEGALECPFAGNLIDLCPTGVYTDKPSRFKGRRWDFQRAPSICSHCSLGCHTTASARYRELVRLEARFSGAVNGYFICDRARFGFAYANDQERPRQARLEGKVVPWRQAVREAARRLREISETGGPDSVACHGSSRNSLETQAMLNYLCQMQGWPQPTYFIDRATARKTKAAVSRLAPDLAVSLRQMEQADFVLALGVDPINEAPMLAMSMRQAWRNGASIMVLDPRPVFLPFEFYHLQLNPDHMEACVSLLVKAAVNRSVVEGLGAAVLEFYDSIPGDYPGQLHLGEGISATAEKLGKCRKPVIICGTDMVRETTPALAADLALLLRAKQDQAGLFYLLPGANGFGGALLSADEGSFAGTLEGMEQGQVKALILVESDPFWLFPDQIRVKLALERLDLFLVVDYLPTRAGEYAQIHLPSQTFYEAGGTLVNQEGRVQVARPVYPGGAPVAQAGGGDHPPRLFGGEIPGGEPKAAWQVLAELAKVMAPGEEQMTCEKLWNWLAETRPVFADLPPLGDLPEGGIRLNVNVNAKGNFSLDWLRGSSGEGDSMEHWELLLVDWTFGTEELSAYSPYIREVERDPCLFMHGEDATRLGLDNGDRLALRLAGGPVEVSLCVAGNMAKGVVVLPRHRQLDWQKTGTGRMLLQRDQIVRASG